MKQLINVVLAAAALLSLYACTDETIGVSLVDTTSSVIEDSSFVMTGKSVLNNRIQMRTSTKMLGELKAQGYGHLTASAVTQWMPAWTIDTSGTSADMIDSCRLKLRMPLRDGYTGDSLAPMRVNVYRLNKQLTSPIYSDFDPTGYYNESDLLASASYSPTAGWTEISSDYSDTVRTISVPLPTSLAQDLFTQYKTNRDLFASPKAMAEYFPGIYITNSYGSGNVLNVKSTEVDVYYRQHVQLTDSTDTIYPAQSQSYLASTPEIISDNIISLDIDPTVTEMVDNGDAIILAPAGYEVQVSFPIQDIIDRYQANVSSDLAVINDLSMEIPVEVPTTEYNIKPPTYLLMVKTSLKDQFINGDSLTNNKDSFYATYDATNKVYKFSDLRDYVLNVLQNEGGIASDADINMTLTPVDLTTYTYSSSYSYYYSSTTTTTVTKISPMVSRPAIVKLKLDKAKIKITYSKQIVN